MNTPILGESVPRRGNKLAKVIALALLGLFGWRVVGDVPNLPKFVVIGAPHTSNWDFVLTIATMMVLQINLSWMGKHTLFKPPFGGLMRWLGGVPIDRRASSGVVEQNVTEFQKRDKFILCITPEGTRSKVREWKMGFYHIAQAAKVPIVMVAFDFGRKVVEFGPSLVPSGDITADMTTIKRYYANITPRHPQHWGHTEA